MRTRSWFVPIAGMLTATAWLVLFVWEGSPYGRYLDHPRWTELGLAAAICRAVPAGEVALPALIYAGGWLLMTAAMMLPTTLPLIYLFERLVQQRPERGQLVALLIAGWSGPVLALRRISSIRPLTNWRGRPAGSPPTAG
jgi:predicted metal-binding membrane protein